MFERVHSVPQLSFFAACMRGTLHTFSEWLRVAAVRSARVLHDVAARRCLRRAIRELHQLDDRTLADIGVKRGEIESAVREGLPMRPLREQAAACDELGSLRQLGHCALVVRRCNLKPLIAAIALATLIAPTFTQVAIAGSPIEVIAAGALTIEPTGSLKIVTASAPADPANRASRDRDAAATRDLQAKQAPRDTTFSAVVAKPRWSSLRKSMAKREDQRPRFSGAATAVSYYSIQSVGLILGVGF